MRTQLVNVRLPKKLYQEGKELVEDEGYANFQEFIKDSIRHAIYEIKKQKALLDLEKNFGIAKNRKIKHLTQEDKEKIAEELAANLENQKEIFKKVGL